MKVSGSAVLFVAAALFAYAGAASAANVNVYQGTFTYGIVGGSEFPLGAFSGRLDNGISGGIALQYMMPADLVDLWPWWKYYFFDMSFRYMYTSLSDSPNSSIAWYSWDVGPVFYYPLSKWAAPFAGVTLGAFYSRMTLDTLDRQDTDYNALARLKAGVIIPATSSLSLRLEGSYSYFNMTPDPFKSAGIALYASYNFTGDTGIEISQNDSQVQIINKNIKNVFAIRFLQYNSQGIGSVTIKNTGNETLLNVRVDVTIDRIATDSKSTDEVKSLEPGDVKMLLLPVAIDEDVYSITEDRRLSMRLRVVYGTASSKNYFIEEIGVPFYSKNAITWDKTEHLGSFIMPQDATVSMFGRKALADSGPAMIKGIPRKFQSAMALFDAMHAYGMVYASDPASGYTAASADKLAVDYVQLPSETLRKKAGDCDDLTVLYASLLENVGVSTAIATVPGHVFLLFNTEIPASCAGELSDDKSLYMERDRMLWVPVEVTALNGSFVQAWKEGARQAGGKAFECMETLKAWENFPPAAGETEYDIDFPDAEKLCTVVSSDAAAIKGPIYNEKVNALSAAVKNDPEDYRAWNELGIIYGRFARLSEAGDCFKKCLGIMQTYYPALVNLGNVFMLQKDFDKAAEYYKRALMIRPDDPGARVNYARALYEQKNFRKAREEYVKAVSADPGIAVRYGYLDRTADVGGVSARSSFSDERYELNVWSGGTTSLKPPE